MLLLSAKDNASHWRRNRAVRYGFDSASFAIVVIGFCACAVASWRAAPAFVAMLSSIPVLAFAYLKIRLTLLRGGLVGAERRWAVEWAENGFDVCRGEIGYAVRWDEVERVCLFRAAGRVEDADLAVNTVVL